MRHRRKTQNLSRFSSYYKATINSLARAVIEHQRIVTTKIRAKLVTPLVNQLVTLGKETDSVDAHRRAFSYLGSHELVRSLFVDIAPMFSQRNGGYTRIIPFKRRRGDNAEMVVLELTEQKKVVRLQKDPKQEALKKERAEHTRTQLREEKKTAAEPTHHGHGVPKDAPKKESKKPVKKGLGIGKIFKAGKESK